MGWLCHGWMATARCRWPSDQLERAAVVSGTSAEKIEWRRERKEGRSTSALSNDDLVSILVDFGEEADQRMSVDRLVAAIVRKR